MLGKTDGKKVVLGFSGGVDSTAAALLLKENGYEVTGLYLSVMGRGRSQSEYEAVEVAGALGIEMLSLDVSEEFGKIVISDFCGAYMKGRTPNPCVVCNPNIKFKYLLRIADERGARHIATGHYAGVFYDENAACYFINKARSAAKDQSYMLYRLGRQVLSRVLFPLEAFGAKEEVRSFVESRGIRNAGKKDSQEICFIDDNINYVDYIKSCGHVIKKGNFVDMNGEIIGVHQGIPRYTVGQRKNLGMTFGKPMFVVRIDEASNEITLGGQEDLMRGEVVSAFNAFAKSDGGEMPEEYDGLSVTAKIRYAAPAAEAVIYRENESTVRTVFKQRQRAATPGQSIVFYIGNKVIGGGIIE